MVHVAIIEDQELVRKSLCGLVESHPNFKLVGAAASVESFSDGAVDEEPDVLLLDINLGKGMSGLEGIRPLKKQYPDTDIVMLTTFDDSEKVFQALCAGATAYLTKKTPFPKVVEAIQIVSNGGSYMSPAIARKVVEHFGPKKKQVVKLTPRQSQVVEAFTEGRSYKMVAAKLLITEETVRDHIKNIYKKLSIHSKSELIAMKLRGELD